jgi:hypothetical protein
MMQAGRWELIFSKARAGDALPVVNRDRCSIDRGKLKNKALSRLRMLQINQAECKLFKNPKIAYAA